MTYELILMPEAAKHLKKMVQVRAISVLRPYYPALNLLTEHATAPRRNYFRRRRTYSQTTSATSSIGICDESMVRS